MIRAYGKAFCFTKKQIAYNGEASYIFRLEQGNCNFDIEKRKEGLKDKRKGIGGGREGGLEEFLKA